MVNNEVESGSIEWKFFSYGKNLHVSRTLDILREEFPECHILLDVGCGSGGTAYHVTRRTSIAYTGVDIDAKAVNFARATVPHSRFICSSAEQLPFDDAGIPYVLSISMLEHTENPDQIVREMARVCSIGGAFVLPCADTFPFQYDPINWTLLYLKRKPIAHGAFGYGHIGLLKKSEWRELLENNGFRVIRELPYDNSLLCQLEFMVLSFVFRGETYSDLPIRSISLSTYKWIERLCSLLRYLDIRTSKSFATTFIVEKK